MEILVLCSGAWTEAKAVEHDRAKEAVKVEDRHPAWKEEGISDPLEWCVFRFFCFFLV